MMQHKNKFHPNLVRKSSIPNEIIENSCITIDDNNSNSFTNVMDDDSEGTSPMDSNQLTCLTPPPPPPDINIS